MHSLSSNELPTLQVKRFVPWDTLASDAKIYDIHQILMFYNN